VHVYQPLSGLHDPRVVDPTAVNLPDVHLSIYCVPGELVNAAEARELCRQTGLLFEQQGATVTTWIRGWRIQAEEDALEADDDAVRTDLTLELRSRQVHKASNTVSWALSIVSLSIVPAVRESTFAQEIEVRDGTGFLLASETLQGRVVERYGVGVWAGNKFLDWAFREDADHLSGDVAKEDLSEDLYGQLSQIVFDARMRWEVQQDAAGP